MRIIWEIQTILLVFVVIMKSLGDFIYIWHRIGSIFYLTTWKYFHLCRNINLTEKFGLGCLASIISSVIFSNKIEVCYIPMCLRVINIYNVIITELVYCRKLLLLFIQITKEYCTNFIYNFVFNCSTTDLMSKGALLYFKF